MEVKIISGENIKPDSPTPPHLRTHKLSFIDQLVPPVYVSVVYFFPGTDQNADCHSRILQLKLSLSQILSRFYPFAGKFKDEHLYIDCNDDGVSFVEARVHANLTTFLHQPNQDLINRLVPQRPNAEEASGAGFSPLLVQANLFECGGMAIGLQTSHKIFDGLTAATFMKAWADTARSSSPEVVYPSFEGPSLFPQNKSILKQSSAKSRPRVFKEGKCVMRRFVFDASSIALLKAKAAKSQSSSSSSSSLERLSRVETVSTFIWARVMDASQAAHGSRRPSVLQYPVNIRNRIVPVLPPHSVGNIVWAAHLPCAADADTGLHNLVVRLREAVAKINTNFVKEMQGIEGTSKICERLMEMGDVFPKEEVDHFVVSSVCKMGFYGLDFGWGEPVWVSMGGMHVETVFTNGATLIDTKSGDGIEARVNLDEQEMAFLERDPLLLSFASLDPTPLPSPLVET